MKAIIFAAGLGTRLKEFTQNCPKALVQVNGKPLLWHAINKLKNTGVTNIVINVHHFSEQIIDYLNKFNFEINIEVSDESDNLLDTGGGLLKARHKLENNTPIIAYNVDVISTVDLKRAVSYHIENKALATLIVRKRETRRYFMFNKNMQLTGWKNYATGEEQISLPDFITSSPMAFSGIQILSPEIFSKITETGKFSITKMYLRLAATEKIIAYPDESKFWVDAGKPEHLKIAEKVLNGS
jgi:NDP-sugar pyrophosphorylase family protein